MIVMMYLFVSSIIAWAANDPFVWVLWVLCTVAVAFTAGEKS